MNGIKPAVSRVRARDGRKQIGEFMRRRVLQLQYAVLRHLAVPGLALMIGYRAAPWPKAATSTARTPDQSGKPAAGAAMPRKDNQRKTDEFVEAAQAINGPAGQPGMRLARTARRAPDVARRSRYRLSSPRPLRPFWLPGRPCPGHLPLPDPIWRPDRHKVAETPEQPRSRLLDQSEAQPQAAAATPRQPPGRRTAGSCRAAPAPAAIALVTACRSSCPYAIAPYQIVPALTFGSGTPRILCECRDRSDALKY